MFKAVFLSQVSSLNMGTPAFHKSTKLMKMELALEVSRVNIYEAKTSTMQALKESATTKELQDKESCTWKRPYQ